MNNKFKSQKGQAIVEFVPSMILFFIVMSAGAFGALDANGKSFFASNNLKVNGQRIEARINELARFGRDENE